jgi:hypothetical protein
MSLRLAFRSVAPSCAISQPDSTCGRFAVAWRYECCVPESVIEEVFGKLPIKPLRQRKETQEMLHEVGASYALHCFRNAP